MRAHRVLRPLHAHDTGRAAHDHRRGRDRPGRERGTGRARPAHSRGHEPETEPRRGHRHAGVGRGRSDHGGHRAEGLFRGRQAPKRRRRALSVRAVGLRAGRPPSGRPGCPRGRRERHAAGHDLVRPLHHAHRAALASRSHDQDGHLAHLRRRPPRQPGLLGRDLEGPHHGQGRVRGLAGLRRRLVLLSVRHHAYVLALRHRAVRSERPFYLQGTRFLGQRQLHVPHAAAERPEHRPHATGLPL